MDAKIRPAPRLAPLPVDANPELKDVFDASKKRMGFVPNSQLIMQRKPKILKAFGALSSAVNDPDGKVPNNFKRLIGHVASRSAGCQYCMAHTAEGAHKQGIDDQKLDAVWDYQTSPLFTPAERAALDVAVAAGTRAERGHRRDVSRTQEALDRGADRRDRRRDRHLRLPQSLERYDGDAAGGRADAFRGRPSRPTRMDDRQARALIAAAQRPLLTAQARVTVWAATRSVPSPMGRGGTPSSLHRQRLIRQDQNLPAAKGNCAIRGMLSCRA